MWNVHRMSKKIEHRNLEIRKSRNDFSVQIRNFLLPLSLKVLRHKERETHSFYSGFFICPHLQHVWHPPQWSPRASENQSSHSVSSSQLTDFFKISQNPPRSSVAWLHSHCVTSFPISAIVTSLSDTSVPRARTWTPALMLHLSNPCSEPKGSQPN